MNIYKEETIEIIKEISQEFISKRQMFVEEIQINWEVKKISNNASYDGFDKAYSKIDVLTPNVKIKIK